MWRLAKLRLGLPALVLPLAACAALEDGELGDILGGGGGSRVVEYRCDDDRRLEVAYNSDRDRVTVDTGRDTYRLRLEDRDGSRRQYGDDEVQLFVDGDEARLRLEDADDIDGCEEV